MPLLDPPPLLKVELLLGLWPLLLEPPLIEPLEEPVELFCRSPNVCWSSCAVCFSPFFFWNCETACLVCGPHLPSIWPC
jgi:hypothetical protein